MLKKIKRNRVNDLLKAAAAFLNASEFEQARSLLEKNAGFLAGNQVFHNMAGVAYAGLREHDAAVKHFLDSIKINPLDPMPFAGIGNSLAKNLQMSEAEKYYKLALVIDENYRDAIIGLGVVDFQRANYPGCEKYFNRALELKPQDPTTLTNLANTYSAQGRYDEALPLWDAALSLKPKSAQALLNRGLAGLGMNKFDSAWDDYEHRFHEDNFIPERFKDVPKWSGPGPNTVPVLIWAEQGIGDEIMFASIFNDLAHIKEKFVAECNPRLINLFRESFPHIFFIPTHSLSDHSAFKYQISAASLGRIFRRTRASFDPSRNPTGYLKQASDKLHPSTLAALRKLPKPWIGVSWESYALTANFRGRKSICNSEFGEFTKDFVGSFINLQFSNPHKHENSGQHSIPESIHSLPNIDLKNDLEAVASLLREMDHVITIGNSVAHLCGSLGTQASVLLPSVADWRWGFSGNKSVWYESLTLHRNKATDSWQDLLKKIKLDVLPHIQT
jgi:tetratricopeptide (TPR) repeat protein